MNKVMQERAISIILLCLIAGTILFAFYPRSADPHGGGIASTEVAEDRGGAITRGQAPSLAFSALANPLFNAGISGSTWWIRLRLGPSRGSRQGTDRYIAVGNPNIDEIDAFFPDGSVVSRGLANGPKRPLTRDWTIPVPAGVNANDEIYIRVRTSNVVRVPFRAFDADGIIAVAFGDALVFGTFLGIMVAVFFVNLFSLMIIRNRNYVLYLLFIAFSVLYQSWANGFLYCCFLPIAVYKRVLWVALCGSEVFGILFAQGFLSLRRRQRGVNTTLLVLLVLVGAQTAIGLAGFPWLAHVVAITLGIFIPLTILVAAWRSFMSGFKPAFYYLLAWAFFATGSWIWALTSFFKSVWPPHYLFLGGAAIESILFTVALFRFISSLLKEKEHLAARERYYLDLSRTDSLTGLYNRRYLNDIVKRMQIESGARLPLSMVMLDLDDFKATNDLHGHQAGDRLLAFLAEQVRSSVRKTDIPCRFGGDEFLIVLPGAGAEIAGGIAEKIRAAVESRTIDGDAGEKLSLTVSLGVSELREGESLDALILRVDMALYAAKRKGKNRYEVL